MTNINLDLYKILIDRLTHFEKLLITMDSFYLAGLYFVFKYTDDSLISLIISSSILIFLSVSIVHLMLVSISYVIDIVDIESRLKISHLGAKWRRFSKELGFTLLFIEYAPAIMTMISLLLLGLVKYDLKRWTLAGFITIFYIILISYLSIRPYREVNSRLKAASIQAEKSIFIIT